MTVVETISQMQIVSNQWRRSGKIIGLVPTMGYLHEGHISLIESARKKGDITVVSIFVNPTQFGSSEDLGTYPRDFINDKRLCEKLEVDALFSPSAEEMYPDRFSTWVVEERLSKLLCGKSRPTHFKGVTTVVCKLFNIVRPDFAVFGQKDAQQALVIKKMTNDLNLSVEILVNPIIREDDGLAMSSRNSYLIPEQRRNATAISRGLIRCKQAYFDGERCATQIKAIVSQEISGSGGIVDYVECVDNHTLNPVEIINKPVLVAVAARYGTTRLIDNCTLGTDP